MLANRPRLRPRGEREPGVTRVDLAELTPEPLTYLGQVAYLELAVFERLTRVVGSAPRLADTEALSVAAGRVLAKHHGFVEEIERLGGDPIRLMGSFQPQVDAFGLIVSGATWAESLLSVHVTTGLLEDFFVALSGGLPEGVGSRAAHLLALDSGEAAIKGVLGYAIINDPRLASTLAMWGRRLVGDTLLLARSALHSSGEFVSGERYIEPVFSELIAKHTRRMDSVGLTA